MTGNEQRMNWGASVRNVVKGLIVAFALAAAISEIMTIVFMMQGAPGSGTLGAAFERTIGPGQQHSIVTDLQPGSPLIAAGIHKGDAVAFDRAIDDGFLSRRLTAGEPVGMTVFTPHPHHVVLTAVPQTTDPVAARLVILDNCTSLLSLTLGSLIVLRARRSGALLALGLGFIIFATFSAIIPQNQTPLAFLIYSLAFEATQAYVATAALLLFAILFYREHNGPVPRWVWPAYWTYIAAFGVITAGWCGLAAWNYSLPLMAHANWLSTIGIYAGLGAAFIGLVTGWARSRRELQKRYAIMTVAISMVIVCDLMFAVSFMLNGGFFNHAYHAVFMAAEWISAAGHLLFAYAVLRDRVIDLGFVINRAVVYGVISALLLVSFGIVEWAIEHFIPIESREKSALLDAAIALGIYLVFHRVRDSVEHFIERLFFHKWHANEEKLRRFVKEADYITHPADLLRAFAAEVPRFCHGAAADICLRDDSGDFTAPGLRIGANEPAMVALRARRDVVEPLSTGSQLATALLLPFVYKGDVFGCVAVAAKPSGAAYRPDEIEALGWAAQQIGLDYHALEAEDARRDIVTLREQNAALTTLIERALTGAGTPA